MKTCYFAASIRGGRDDQPLYFALIEHLSQFCTVLTEHFGSSKLSLKGEDGVDDDYIYDRDMRWLLEADMVIAEVSTPSLGVGYEIAKAEEWRKPVLCLHRSTGEMPLSAIIGGTPHSKVVRYHDEESAKVAIKAFVEQQEVYDRGEPTLDAPFCDACGHITVRHGTVFNCLHCGNVIHLRPTGD